MNNKETKKENKTLVFESKANSISFELVFSESFHLSILHSSKHKSSLSKHISCMYGNNS